MQKTIKCKLPLKIIWHTHLGKICKIELSLNDTAELEWQIISETQDPSLNKAIKEWIKMYIAKKTLPILPFCLENFPLYTKCVLNTLPKIPLGKTVTYQELASMAGHPKAIRAAGSACRRNPLPLLIPCHRVLGSKGIGGFSGGIALKKLLLDHEGYR